MSEEPELIALLKKMRFDLTAMQVKLSEALRMAADANLPEPKEHACVQCGVSFRGELALAEHHYISHSGDVPEHWKEAERLAAQEAE